RLDGFPPVAVEHQRAGQVELVLGLEELHLHRVLAEGQALALAILEPGDAVAEVGVHEAVDLARGLGLRRRRQAVEPLIPIAFLAESDAFADETTDIQTDGLLTVRMVLQQAGWRKPGPAAVHMLDSRQVKPEKAACDEQVHDSSPRYRGAGGARPPLRR